MFALQNVATTGNKLAGHTGGGGGGYARSALQIDLKVERSGAGFLIIKV